MPALGTLIAHLIGWPLIPLQFRQQRFESDFRFAIARVTDYADSVALMDGEPVERGELRRRFVALVRNWVALVNRQNRLNGFIFGYYHVSTVFPTLVVTPAYLVGAITLGVLMQAALAFQKVESRLRLLHHVLCEDRRVARGDEPRGAVRGGDGRGGSARPAGRFASTSRNSTGARSVDQGSRAAAAGRRTDRVGGRARSGAGGSAAGERSVGSGQIEPVPRARRHLAAR